MEEKSIFIVYRDNDLFAEYVPAIVAKLQELGRAVEVKVFPRDTVEEEIGKWLEERASTLKGKTIACDKTTLRSLPRSGCLWDLLGGLMEPGDYTPRARLDDTFASAACDLFYPEKEDLADRRSQPSTEAYRQAFTELFRRILQVERPKRIFLSRELLSAHDPFSYGLDNRRWERSDFDDGTRERCFDKANDDVADDLRHALERAGYAWEDIEVVGSITDCPKEGHESWILYDRHEEKPAISMRKLQIPLENLIRDAHAENLLPLGVDEIRDTIVKQMDYLKYW